MQGWEKISAFFLLERQLGCALQEEDHFSHVIWMYVSFYRLQSMIWSDWYIQTWHERIFFNQTSRKFQFSVSYHSCACLFVASVCVYVCRHLLGFQQHPSVWRVISSASTFCTLWWTTTCWQECFSQSLDPVSVRSQAIVYPWQSRGGEGVAISKGRFKALSSYSRAWYDLSFKQSVTGDGKTSKRGGPLFATIMFVTWYLSVRQQ